MVPEGDAGKVLVPWINGGSFRVLLQVLKRRLGWDSTGSGAAKVLEIGLPELLEPVSNALYLRIRTVVLRRGAWFQNIYPTTYPRGSRANKHLQHLLKWCRLVPWFHQCCCSSEHLSLKLQPKKIWKKPNLPALRAEMEDPSADRR